MRALMAVLIAFAVGGCADEESGTLSCPAPGETGCESLDAVYQSSAGGDADSGSADVLRRVRTAPGNPEPTLTKPRVIRVWLSPWQDEQGDLHDQQYLYLVVEPSRWDVDHMIRPGAGAP